MAKLRVDKIASVGVSTETTGSVFFDNSGDYLVPPVDDDELILGDTYSVEWWHYLSAIGTGDKRHGFVMAASAETTTANEDGALAIYTENDGSNQFIRVRANNTGSDVSTPAGSVLAEVWQHCAVQVNGNSCEIYIDGALKASGNTNGSVTQRIRRIGSVYFTNTDYDTQGYISNLRICKGHVVYTSNFTPPTRELEAHAGSVDDRTVLLCCYDGDNIFAEKTGRILRAVGDRISSPTPTATDSPIGITTLSPGLTRDVDVTAGPVFQGGAAFTSQNWLTLPKGTTTQRNRGRGVFGGGNPGSANNTMQYVQIQSQGNALDFGDLTVARQASGLGGATRGVFGGNAHPNGDTMDFITIASTGNAVDFGNLQSSLNGRASAANLTRGIFAGGGTPTVSNEIDFITIATLGNASDFGNLSVARRNHAGVASPTRAVFAGGDAGSTNDTIDFVTIATTGNATDFGNLSAARETAGGASSSTRGVFMGGYTSGDVDIIEYITIATTGNATDFGNLSAARRNGGSVSNNIRGLYAGGHPSVNTIEFVTIATTGDANDFGDLFVGQRINPNHVSDSHGGLS